MARLIVLLDPEEQMEDVVLIPTSEVFVFRKRHEAAYGQASSIMLQRFDEMGDGVAREGL